MTTSREVAAIRLDDRLCLALYTASRAMTARYRPLLAALDLTYPQYLVMVLLWEDGPSSVGQIGSRLRLDSSTLSPLLKRLEGMGLVSRTRDPRDERSVTVAPTASGRALERSSHGVTAAVCESAGLTLPEQAALVVALRRVADELESSTRAG